MSRRDEYEKQVIEHADRNGELLTGDDGYVAYWPGEGRGFLTECDLRILADELTRRNKDWDEEVNRFFAEQRKKEGTRTS